MNRRAESNGPVALNATTNKPRLEAVGKITKFLCPNARPNLDQSQGSEEYISQSQDDSTMSVAASSIEFKSGMSLSSCNRTNNESTTFIEAKSRKRTKLCNGENVKNPILLKSKKFFTINKFSVLNTNTHNFIISNIREPKM